MPRGRERANRPTREELTARLEARNAERKAAMDARALEVLERIVQRHVAHSTLPGDIDAWNALPATSKQLRRIRAQEHSEKLKEKALAMFDAAEQIDARIAEFDAG